MFSETGRDKVLLFTRAKKMNEEMIVAEIRNKLTEIEEKENVTILFAVESGSRAWGFASPDSDFDVRFVYKHNDIREYLKLEGIRDVIEWELNDIYDISGWDLDKTLKLVHNSNPVVFEWIASPIIYHDTGFLKDFQEFISPYFMTIKGAHHYLHMARRNYEEYLSGEEVKLKKYFYVLRPLLALKYVLDKRSNPPMLFESLFESELADEEVKNCVKELIRAKKNSTELGKSPKIRLLDDFIGQQLLLLDNEVNSLKKESTDWKDLDEFFYQTLNV